MERAINFTKVYSIRQLQNMMTYIACLVKDKHIEDIQQLKDKASITMDNALLRLQKEQLSQNQLKYNEEIQ